MCFITCRKVPFPLLTWFFSHGIILRQRNHVSVVCVGKCDNFERKA